VPVRVIIGLPFPQDEGHGFTEDGEYIRITSDTIMRILTGVIVATKKHSAYEVQQFCRNPNLTIELAFASSEAFRV